MYTGIMLAIVAGGAVGLLTWGMVRLVMTGWASYERRYVEGAEETLEGMFMTIPAKNLAYLSLAGVLFGGGLAYLVTGSPVLALAAGIVFFMLPRLALNWLKNHRQRRFVEQLPDALHSISNSLKSGYSVPQSIELIAREMDNPISQEFKLVGQEMQIGTPMEESMQHMQRRMPSREIDLVVAAIIIARTVGGNLSEILENIADTIRERLRVEGRIRSLTAQGKLQGWVMCAMPFFLAFMYYLVAPDFIRPVFQTVAGYLLLGVILVLETIGILIIRRIVKVDI